MAEKWVDLGLVRAEPALQMALDEVLLGEVGAGRRPCLVRFWEWTKPCLVLGCNQSVVNEVDCEVAGRLGFELARRMSGGGTMVCEPGRTITWSLYLPERLVQGMDFRQSYAQLDAWAVTALRNLGLAVEYRPINEIATSAGKLSGAAQARRRQAILHHVTMAYAIDAALVPRLIRIGRPRLSDRGVRSAEREVASLGRFVDLSWEEAVSDLSAAFRAGREVTNDEITAGEWSQAQELARTKYATHAWIYRHP